jgi:hypothetical protein
MVETARTAMSNYYGISLDFCLVDGGSQDGTQAWCREQPDVTLVEHGDLRGAVKAFNDGARAATGEYVIMANDDIEFLDDGILQAWIYMQSNPDCGVGCFYQDRNGRDWHVESMPAVSQGGEQIHVPYGQVCMVPRWLGDRVGWWGDYLHTYGGDNELSAQIITLGYKASPVEGARIHDAEADDDLRKINNISGAKDPRAVRGHHPDSWAWGRAWRGRQEHLQFARGPSLVGPLVRNGPQIPNPIVPRERVLYLPIYEQGWPIQKQQKRGLREALAKVGLVAEYDYVGRFQEAGKDIALTEMQFLLHQIKPTLILSQLHNGEQIGPGVVGRLRDAAPGVTWVNWNGDYWPENLTSEEGLALARSFDLQLTVNRKALNDYDKHGIKANYWQIGWEPDGVGHAPDGAACDLVFLGNRYSQARTTLVRHLRKEEWLDFHLHGQGWPDGWARGACLYDFITACKLYRAAKFSLGDSQWPNSGFVSNRVMQALVAGGSVLCHQWFARMEELGLEDGLTCIVWKEYQELVSKIKFYLEHEDQRQAMAEAGQRLALDRHSFDVRVSELLGMLDGRPAPAQELEMIDDWR